MAIMTKLIKGSENIDNKLIVMEEKEMNINHNAKEHGKLL